MFDKLVESDSAGAEFKNRSRYFMVSSIVVGILFLTAVVYSLYAAEVGLGKGNFEIAELLAPVSAEAPEPEITRKPAATAQTSPTARSVNSNTARPDEHPIAPIGVSVQPKRQPSRGWEKFDPRLPKSIESGQPAALEAGGRTTGSTSSRGSRVEQDEPEENPSTPPPAIKPKPEILKISRVLNGSAISLPKPGYPPNAAVLNLEGSARIQVTIDESGKVISAKAVDGHPFFRVVAERAALGARFRPTLLNDEPVKVTGVIIYTFRRN